MHIFLILPLLLATSMDAFTAGEWNDDSIMQPKSSVKAANKPCTSTGGYRMVFPERTITNYALVENAITHKLYALTLSFFVKDNPLDTSLARQCAYSYAVPGQHNEFSFCTSPTLEAVINGTIRKTDVSIEDGQLHHICFTWKSCNGEYQFFKDGQVEASGIGFQQDYKIRAGGSLVLGQDQDMLAGDFNVNEAFVGELSQLNVWDEVLPRTDIVDQYNKCVIGKGSINWWAQFKDSVHGDIKVKP